MKFVIIIFNVFFFFNILYIILVSKVLFLLDNFILFNFFERIIFEYLFLFKILFNIFIVNFL